MKQLLHNYVKPTTVAPLMFAIYLTVTIYVLTNMFKFKKQDTCLTIMENEETVNRIGRQNEEEPLYNYIAANHVCIQFICRWRTANWSGN